MSLIEIAGVVGGEACGEARVTGPAFVDSRRVEPGGLFVAVAGEHTDGHGYAAAAVGAGAAAVLGSRPTGVPTVVVPDPVAALGKLARHVVDSLPQLTVFALTGSQGKTGTKDYLAQLLATAGPTVATAGNFNNEIGVPLTVLRATTKTRHLVVEMGARGTGHIRYLCEVAPPRIAAVLNVGTAHMSEFGTVEAIAQAKGEIVEALPEDGVAVLNADDPLVAAMAQRTPARVVWWGEGEGSRGELVSFSQVELDELGRPRAVLTLPAATPGQVSVARVGLQELGAHQLKNASAAAAMALAAGVDAETVTAALGRARSQSHWRMELHERADGVAVINDAYNANPASMGAALDTLDEIRRRSGRRTIAVLGEMKELGEGSAEAHAGVGRTAAERGVDVLLAVGEPARAMVEGANNVTSWAGTAVSVPDRAAALAWLREYIAAGDVVLVKASRGAALELVAQGLADLEEGETD